ncbi:MAG: pyridoxamine 5'-phosphate oxidase family protein [Pedobacter sp.]|nr:pyridoxamine 5'-phosphate oxidase family protein [Pedobacter sp.]
MSTIKNLSNESAIEKLKDLAEGKMCLFCTKENEKLESRPMGASQVDDAGDLWFFSAKNSNKNRQIQADPEVYLMFMEPGKQHYLSLTTEVEIVEDQQKIDELWNDFLNAWFPGGKDDPQISLLKASVISGHYWDEKDGHLIGTLKAGLKALTGGKTDDGALEGDINV